MGKKKKIETILAQACTRMDKNTGAVSVPIYQTATFAHPELGVSTGFDYSRTSNPTRQALEQLLATADGGHGAFAFSSGLAAIDSTMRLFRPGSRMVVTEDLYGGTFRLFERILKLHDIVPIYVDTTDCSAVAEALAQDSVRCLFVESPTNPLLKVADIRALAAMAKERDVLFIVDNTFLTPFNQRPLEQGADLVVYSATKYLAGHNDVVAGAVVTRTPALSEQIAFVQNGAGAILGPMDAWLLIRGLKSLPLRMERQQKNARALAEWLASHPRVKRVFYPGLPDHPGRSFLEREQAGYGGMLSFEVDDAERVPAILKGVQTFLFAESLGGVESLITYPLVQTHADMDAATLERLGITKALLRLSVGIEHIQDLIADLDAVL